MLALRRGDHADLFGQAKRVDGERVFGKLRAVLDPVLEAMRRLGTGWDGYKAAPPNEPALARAQRALDELRDHGLEPDRIVPDASGSVCLLFFDPQSEGQRFADLSLDNDGSVALLRVDRVENLREVHVLRSGEGLVGVMNEVRGWVRR